MVAVELLSGGTDRVGVCVGGVGEVAVPPVPAERAAVEVVDAPVLRRAFIAVALAEAGHESAVSIAVKHPALGADRVGVRVGGVGEVAVPPVPAERAAVEVVDAPLLRRAVVAVALAEAGFEGAAPVAVEDTARLTGRVRLLGRVGLRRRAVAPIPVMDLAVEVGGTLTLRAVVAHPVTALHEGLAAAVAVGDRAPGAGGGAARGGEREQQQPGSHPVDLRGAQ